MTKEIIINIKDNETMVAVTENHQLAEIFFERQQNKGLLGNFYVGKIENVLPGMQAAFVDISEAKNGFLYINDAVPRVVDGDGNTVEPTMSIDKVLKKGDKLLVQIMKEPVGSKGARVTTHPTIPGRYTVLMPTINYVGISRRITDETEANRLKEIVNQSIDENMGIIVRTAAQGIDAGEIGKEIKGLVKHWWRIKEKSSKVQAPSLIYKESPLLERVIRDIFVGDIACIYVNSANTKELLQGVLADLLPEYLHKITVCQQDIMTINDLSSQIEKAIKPKVWLKCGGYLVIEQTEALTVIDVNTGKYVGDGDFAATILKTNLDAALEIARQIRLRNIGGIIIVDFIDMKELVDREKVIAVLEEELKKDRVKTNILGLTQLGLLEMTRKKSGLQLSDVLQQDCPFCNGKGKMITSEIIYNQIKQEISSILGESNCTQIYVEANPVIASYLIGANGYNLKMFQETNNKELVVKGNAAYDMEQFIVRPHYAGSEIISTPVQIGQVLEVYIEDTKADNVCEGLARIDGFVLLIENGVEHLNQTVKVQITEIFKTYGKGIII